MRVALALAVALAAPAWAEDFVAVPNRLSDKEFHRLVACGAAPGGACKTPVMRWDRRDRADLRVAVMPADAGYPPRRAAQVEAAVDAALAALNGAGAGLRLRRVAPDDRPHIRLYRSRLKEGDKTRGIEGVPDGEQIGAGFFFFRTDNRDVIDYAVVVIAADIDSGSVRSIVLEEITQSLGLLHDVAGPAYRDRSIFSEYSNAVRTIAGQDMAIMRLHYPPT